MKKTEIKIVIEGMPEDEGFVRANALIRGLDSVVKNIYAADKIISRRGTNSFYFRILDLSSKSPATIIMEAIPEKPEIDIGDKAIRKFSSVYHSIQKGALKEEEIEYGLIESLMETTNIIGKSINSMRIITDEYDLDISKEFKAKLDLFVAPEEKSKGFIRGMLEYINIHEGKNVFKIYPDIGPTKVTCHFPKELTMQAIEAIGKYVEVKGELRYKTISKYPHEIFIEAIEAFPEEKELPSLYDLRGIAPDLTGKLSSEQFVRKIRHAQI